MKRYIVFAVILVTLFGCTSIARIPNHPTDASSSAVSTATIAESALTTEESLEPTQPQTTAAIITGFDPTQIIATMTLEEKVGQLFLARCSGENAVSDLQKYHLGGYIFTAMAKRLCLRYWQAMTCCV